MSRVPWAYLSLKTKTNKTNNDSTDCTCTEVGLSKRVAATLYPGHHFILHLYVKALGQSNFSQSK